ncbi:16215_t:CDS:2 [Cetraspora pellucida]|uniref:16215_t:CDS:1 n=1 Tax=Cetraspora pellucida TaxID=1433469 RepID=A0A9N8WLA6_9GLOM|nr:16215_t:CDS:2 [Cetraspora pellucida]
MMELEEYIDYSEESNNESDDDDSVEMHQSEHDEALLKLQKDIRKLQNAVFKQTNIETYFESAS